MMEHRDIKGERMMKQRDIRGDRMMNIIMVKGLI